MPEMKRLLTVAAVVSAVILAAVAVPRPAAADEGMWTFDNPPVVQLQKRYGFTPTKAWLDHVRLSSVRFNDGGSGSFVSPHGLVLTNHHVARGQLQKVSTPEKNYVADGFVALTPEQELPCPDLELNVLMSMENVTSRVTGAVKKGMTDEQALEARKAAIAGIERESQTATGLRSDVVTLYHGGEYWLYRYKKYTDVRLVFAPEEQAAFFGGDPDNFTYPRYDLDMALFRVYEDGKPIASPDYLRWSSKGAAPGELVFVSGNPGSTDRLDTMAQLETLRDHTYPMRLAERRRILAVAQAYAARGEEQAREANVLIFGLQNSIKAMTGEYEGLQNPRIMARRGEQEKAFRALVAADETLEKAYGGAWDAIAQAQKTLVSRLVPYTYRDLAGYRLPRLATQIVEYVAEVTKPDGERLQGFHEAQLASLRFRMFSPAPVYPGLEEALLASGLERSLTTLGADDPFVKAVLQGRTPAEVAHDVIAGTRLADPAFRRSLVEGGEKAVEASTDPLIVLARAADPFVREMRSWHEDKVESVQSAASEKLGAARFAVYGKSAYPDATFTLRLAYGTVKGYPMNGTVAPPETTLYGLYNRSAGFGDAPPFDLPRRFVQRRSALDLATPMNFVSTCDIIGGNSGSPVINTRGELVGLIFDGNIESLVGRFVYDEDTNRAVAVHPAVMIEALRRLYDAGSIADELEGR